MAHTFALRQARTSSAGNPITVSLTVQKGDTVIAVLLKVVGSTNRAGGAPTWGGSVCTQANSTQKAASSPEASAELWYLENPTPGTATLTIPNTGAATCKYTIVAGQARSGGHSKFAGASGGNATATNPSPGAVNVGEDGMIAFAITAGGWTTWAPSAQVGTIIANTDDGADGGGEQYILNPPEGPHTLGWTFATSDDWGAVSAYFAEVAPHSVNNYQSVDVGDGMSCTEKTR